MFDSWSIHCLIGFSISIREWKLRSSFRHPQSPSPSISSICACYLVAAAAEGLALTEGAKRPREAAHPKRHIQCSTLPLAASCRARVAGMHCPRMCVRICPTAPCFNQYILHPSPPCMLFCVVDMHEMLFISVLTCPRNCACVLHAIHAKQRGGARGGTPPAAVHELSPPPISFLFLVVSVYHCTTAGAPLPRTPSPPCSYCVLSACMKCSASQYSHAMRAARDTCKATGGCGGGDPSCCSTRAIPSPYLISVFGCFSISLHHCGSLCSLSVSISSDPFFQAGKTWNMAVPLY